MSTDFVRRLKPLPEERVLFSTNLILTRRENLSSVENKKKSLFAGTFFLSGSR